MWIFGKEKKKEEPKIDQAEATANTIKKIRENIDTLEKRKKFIESKVDTTARRRCFYDYTV